MPSHPNLIFIFADQMRGMDMGCMGNFQVHTPTMDRMAAQGLKLTRCFATSPLCGPNRAILLTGTYPTTNRVVVNDLPLRTDLPGLGTTLKEAGFRTGYIGKWHLDGIPRSRFTPPGPRRHGFDFWAAYNCTHDYFHPRYYRDTPDLIEASGYEPEVQTDLALEFLRDHSSDRPFCLMLSWGPPHDPYDQVPAAYRSRYDPSQLILRPNVDPDAVNPLASGLDCRRVIADYYAAIAALDDQLARILDALTELQIDQDTIVVFTSDHGDMLWSHGMLKKQTPYEESIHVPLLVRWPQRIAPGRVSDHLIGTVDLMPTLLGLLGVDQAEGTEGRDLSQSVLALDVQATRSDRDSLYIINPCASDEAIRQQLREWRGVRTAHYTYAEQVGRVPWLLFDNETDIYQRVNLVEDAAHQTVRTVLADTLTEWLDRTGDPFAIEAEMIVDPDMLEIWNRRQVSVD